MAGLARPSGPPRFIGNVLMAMGPERGRDYRPRLAGQRVAKGPGNQRVVLDQCIAGQYPLVPQIHSYHAAISMAQGAPVQLVKLAPTVASFGCMGPVKNAPHPFRQDVRPPGGCAMLDVDGPSRISATTGNGPQGRARGELNPGHCGLPRRHEPLPDRRGAAVVLAA